MTQGLKVNLYLIELYRYNVYNKIHTYRLLIDPKVYPNSQATPFLKTLLVAGIEIEDTYIHRFV